MSENTPLDYGIKIATVIVTLFVGIAGFEISSAQNQANKNRNEFDTYTKRYELMTDIYAKCTSEKELDRVYAQHVIANIYSKKLPLFVNSGSDATNNGPFLETLSLCSNWISQNAANPIEKLKKKAPPLPPRLRS